MQVLWPMPSTAIIFSLSITFMTTLMTIALSMLLVRIHSMIDRITIGINISILIRIRSTIPIIRITIVNLSITFTIISVINMFVVSMSLSIGIESRMSVIGFVVLEPEPNIQIHVTRCTVRDPLSMIKYQIFNVRSTWSTVDDPMFI